MAPLMGRMRTRTVAARCWCDSGSSHHTATRFSRHRIAANQPTQSTPRWSNTMLPMGGPKMKPSPKAAPINPMDRARLSGGVMSVM